MATKEKKEGKDSNIKYDDEKQKHFNLVGERLKELRIQEGLAYKEFEEELGLLRNSLHRLEKGHGGTIISFLTVLIYFKNKGYNLNWILDIDNIKHFKKEDTTTFLSFDKELIMESGENIIKEVKNLVKILDGIK